MLFNFNGLTFFENNKIIQFGAQSVCYSLELEKF